MSIQVLSTGGEGLVGSRVRELAPPDFDWTDFDIASSNPNSRLDVTDPEQVKAALGRAGSGDVVVHFAAYTDVAGAWEQRYLVDEDCWKLNVTGTSNVAEACAEAGKYLVLVSTDFVLGGQNWFPYDEASPRKPIEWYGTTKALAESAVEKVCGDNATIVRIGFPFTAESARPDIVRTMQARLRSGNLPPQFTDQTITPTAIDDIAGALELVIRERPGGILHAVGSSSLSPHELAVKVAAVSGLDQEVVEEGSFQYFRDIGRSYPQHLEVLNGRIRDLGANMLGIGAALERFAYQQDAAEAA